MWRAVPMGQRIGASAAILLLLVCASAPAMAACNINGAWLGNYSGTDGTGTLTVTFFNSTSTSFNMNVVAVFVGQGTITESPSGSISGSTLSWNVSASFPTGTVTQTGTGTIGSDCNTITGSVVTVPVNDPTSSDNGTFTLTRQAGAPSVGAVTFQQTAIGSPSAPQPFSFTNSGTGTLSLGPVTTDGDFSANSTCGSALAAGASCGINVTCNPSGPGIRNGTLYINDPSKTPIGSVSLTCSGVQPLAGANFLPVSGWWWDSKLNGTGFFIEYGGKSGLGMFVGGFLYDANKSSTWLVSTGPLTSTTFTSTWLKVSGGQTLTGPYKSPSQAGAGNVTVKFVDESNAVLTRPDGSQINLTRFPFSSGTTPAPPVAGAPQGGWWWAGSSLAGTGYGIEIQGSAVFIVAYVYDTSGNPIWYLANGSLTSPTSYSGTWQLYSGGPQLTSPEGTYTPQTVTGSDVAMSLSFSDSTHGTLTMGSTVIPIVRFQEY